MAPRHRTLVALVASLLGCAEGGSITGLGGGATGGSAGVGNNTSSSGGSGGAPTQSGPTTTGPSCEETPCRLVEPQCGCAAGEACTIDGMGGRLCLASGAVPPGGACDESNLCAPGAACIGYGPGQNTCAAFCNDNGLCELPGGQCVVELAAQPGVLMCSENCDLTTSQGCSLAGMSCQLGITAADTAYTLCTPSGTLVEQEVCADNSECAPAYVCLPTTANDNRCFHWCAVGGAACPVAGDVCTGLEVTMGVPLMIGSTTYGVCNPG